MKVMIRRVFGETSRLKSRAIQATAFVTAKKLWGPKFGWPGFGGCGHPGRTLAIREKALLIPGRH
jgi:hypothetical protein